jgi:hypothetical protein
MAATALISRRRQERLCRELGRRIGSRFPKPPWPPMASPTAIPGMDTRIPIQPRAAVPTPTANRVPSLGFRWRSSVRWACGRTSNGRPPSPVSASARARIDLTLRVRSPRIRPRSLRAIPNRRFPARRIAVVRTSRTRAPFDPGNPGTARRSGAPDPRAGHGPPASSELRLELRGPSVTPSSFSEVWPVSARYCKIRLRPASEIRCPRRSSSSSNLRRRTGVGDERRMASTGSATGGRRLSLGSGARAAGGSVNGPSDTTPGG